jgi:hypothetical protein
MGELSGQGVTVDLPPGWEGKIFRRPASGEVTSADTGPPAAPGSTTHTVVQLASIPLPPGTGDFGSGAVERLGANDALVVVFEYDAISANAMLFQTRGLPRDLDPDAFSPDVLQRTRPHQAGAQLFFTEAGRPCCLYVVLGRYANRHQVVPHVNEVLRTLRIEPHGGRASTAMPEPPSTTQAPPSSSATTTTPQAPERPTAAGGRQP